MIFVLSVSGLEFQLAEKIIWDSSSADPEDEDSGVINLLKKLLQERPGWGWVGRMKAKQVWFRQSSIAGNFSLISQGTLEGKACLWLCSDPSEGAEISCSCTRMSLTKGSLEECNPAPPQAFLAQNIQANLLHWPELVLAFERLNHACS